MAYCNNCGKELNGEMKFCPHCGSPVEKHEKNAKRETICDGEIHKCPNCGEVLESFTAVCPSCGYEIRGAKTSASVGEFSMRLSASENDERKIGLIRSFPIPNTKEDILEFMILAASNFDANCYVFSADGKKIADAWLAKIEQCRQKAEITFSGESDFLKIQNIYDKIHTQIKKLEQKEKKNAITDILLQTIGVWSGLIIFIIAAILDVSSDIDTSIFHLGGAAVMIVGAFMVGRKSKMLYVVVIGIACSALTLALGTLLQEAFMENGSAMTLAGGASLILIIVGLAKTFIKRG